MKHSGFWLSLLLLAMVWTNPLRAQTQVQVRGASGEVYAGALTALSIAEGVSVQTKTGSQNLPLRQTMNVRFVGVPIEIPDLRSDAIQFNLAGGERLYGQILESDFDVLKIQTGSIGKLDLAMDHLAELQVLRNTKGLGINFAKDAPNDRDLVFVRSKLATDHVVGEVARFAGNGVYFEWNDAGETLFAFDKDKVAAVRLAEPEPPLSGKDLYAVVSFRDGSRIRGQLNLVSGSYVFRPHFGGEFRLKTDQIAEVSFRNTDFEFLSDLKAKVDEKPFLKGGLRYGLHRDRGLRGHEVKIADVAYSKSLCVHSRCDLQFDLGGRYESFTADIGIDQAVSKRRVRGAVAFSVLVDGKVLAGPIVKRAGESASRLKAISLKGAKTLVLRAAYADNFHFNAWAVWGAPILLRTAGKK